MSSKSTMKATQVVRLPKPLWGAIKSVATREKMPMWKVIMRAWSYYIKQYREHHEHARTTLEKAAWYCFKLSSSVGQFKERPNKFNYEMLKKTAEQLKKRLQIDVDLLLGAAGNYYMDHSATNKMALNDATKMVVATIIAMSLY